jgi:hypothetical protein
LEILTENITKSIIQGTRARIELAKAMPHLRLLSEYKPPIKVKMLTGIPMNMKGRIWHYNTCYNPGLIFSPSTGKRLSREYTVFMPEDRAEAHTIASANDTLPDGRHKSKA